MVYTVCVCVCSGLALMEMVRVTKPSAFLMQQKEKLQKEMDELLGTDGVFLYPSHPRVAPKHHHPFFRLSDCAYTGQSSSEFNRPASSVQCSCERKCSGLIFLPYLQL